MSQGQPQRPQQDRQQEHIKYGDVLNVSDDLTSKTVAPPDSGTMQSAEAMAYGKTQKGGPAAAMQSAADINERTGLVGHLDGSYVTDTVTEVDVIIPESVGGQVVGQSVENTPVLTGSEAYDAQQAGSITIGEALNATAKTAGDKPVDQSDAAAIQSAEARAVGTNVINPGGLASAAQSAAALNAQIDREGDKVKLSDVLTNATVKLPDHKTATRQDAAGVVNAEIRNNPNLATHPGGVGASVAAAARMNERTQ